MKLHMESDAVYLSAKGAKSRIGGYFYLGPVSSPFSQLKPINTPIYIECSLIKHIVSSTAEAETAGISRIIARQST